MSVRLAAKAGLAGLLTRAKFSRNRLQGAWAWRRAQSLREECPALL